MSDNSTIFSGSSRYSADFQSTIQRAVSIASLPITLLNNQKNTLTSKQTAYQTLETKVESVRTAVTGLKSALGTNSYSTVNSEPTVASASVSEGALEADYTITVVDAGAYTRSMSTGNLSAELTAGSAFTLTVDGANETITPSDGTMSSLAAAINSAQTAVQASVVNLGTTASPDYRLSLQTTGVKNSTITLTAGGSNLVNTLVTGHEATYQVNGQPSTPISTDSRSVTLAPGVVVTLAKAGETELSVKRNSTSVSMAIGSLVTAYNNAMDELDKSRGESAGVLEGDSQIWTISSALRKLVNYEGDGTASSMAALGLSFDQKGRLSFDSSSLSKYSVAQIEEFLGDGTGSGFLKNATDVLDSIDASGRGLIDSTLDSLGTQITRVNSNIDSEQNRVDLLEKSLTAQMAAADAAIAAMEQQVTYFDGLFEAMKQSKD